MPISIMQTAAVMEVINVILSTTGPKKRQLASMFLDLVDRTDWPQYYEVRNLAYHLLLIYPE